MIYVDSSVLLSVYLSQPRAAEARLLLATPETKVSSWLLAIEVPIVLRRLLLANDPALLKSALLAFDADLPGIHLYAALPEIAARIRSDARFSQCRALDALHIAAALLLKEELSRPIVVATFDERQRQLAAHCGLGTLPA